MREDRSLQTSEQNVGQTTPLSGEQSSQKSDLDLDIEPQSEANPAAPTESTLADGRSTLKLGSEISDTQRQRGAKEETERLQRERDKAAKAGCIEHLEKEGVEILSGPCSECKWRRTSLRGAPCRTICQGTALS